MGLYTFPFCTHPFWTNIGYHLSTMEKSARFRRAREKKTRLARFLPLARVPTTRALLLQRLLRGLLKCKSEHLSLHELETPGLDKESWMDVSYKNTLMLY